MKTVIAKMEVVSGKIALNLQTIREFVKEAKEQKAELLVLPELCLSGHFLMDRWFDENWKEELVRANAEIVKLSQGLTIVWGNLVQRNGYYFNAVLAANDNAYLIQEKSGLNFTICRPALNSIFNDSRYFTDYRILLSEYQETDLLDAFTVKGKKLYLCGGEYWLKEEKGRAFLKQLPSDSLIVNILNQSSQGKTTIELRESIQNLRTKAAMVVCNRLGVENNSSCVYVYEGSCLAIEAGQYYLHSGSGYQTGLVSEVSPIKEDATEELLTAMLYGLKQLDSQLFGGRVKWVIGLSGGLDSSISAALLTMALGKERIIGYNLASRYNKEITKSNAQQLAEALGISYHVTSIEGLVEATITAMETANDQEIVNLTRENIQARLRGHLLSSFAAQVGGVISNNGNKVEAAFGYCTLYGDSIGALAILGDLMKVELFALAHAINKRSGHEVIPENLLPTYNDYHFTFTTAPSAELSSGQVDPMKWGYHDLLLAELLSPTGLRLAELLESYRDNRWQDRELGNWVKTYFTDNKDFVADLKWVIGSIQKNAFKRIQSPPILSLSATTLGGAYLENQGTWFFTEKEETLLHEIENQAI